MCVNDHLMLNDILYYKGFSFLWYDCGHAAKHHQPMPEKISVVAVGSRGDVQPYIALAAGLRRAGYRVQVVTHREFAPPIIERGLEFYPLPGEPSQILKEGVGRKWMHTGGRPLHFGYYFVKLMRPLLEALLSDMWQACQDSDVIVYSRLGIAAKSVAEKLNVPGILTSVQPLGRTRYYPAAGAPEAPDWIPGRRAYNWMSHLVLDQLFWLPFRGIINGWRRDLLGLPAAPLHSTYVQVAEQGGPLLLAHSQSLVPSPPDWPDWIYPTGFWMLENDGQYRPPDPLRAFLEGGSPPVYIGFGSTSFADPLQMIELVLSALKQSQQRGILHVPWDDLEQLTLPQQVIAVNNVPFDWLFPRIAAAVYHGGIGTGTIALRAGLPTVTVPFYGDQLYWARRIADAGASVEPLEPRRLTADKLALAISHALDHADIRRNAKALGDKLREEDGVGKAVEVIQKYVA
jgi:UDP:flavonoid glycosyltransferase YjiC (YdhE family)